MQLNIKHPEAYRLARAIAEATGSSLTDAVITALRHESDRLDAARQDRDADIAERMRRIRAIQDYVQRTLSPEDRARILDDDLYYDEYGLPK